MKVLCVGGPKHGEYVEVTNPSDGLVVALPPYEPRAWMREESDMTRPRFPTLHYRMEKFAVRGAFIAPVLVAEGLSEDRMTEAILSLAFRPEFLETGI